ncbi:hypothetical protein AAY86_07720 [Pseudomonas amygdali pv. tabaci str. ATCC 11528]|uniref:Uncharacterized protein n=6 Tax=Pseudomonas syringae group TaxID=136849 RepID=A0AAX1VXT7_PSEAJ|nr:hypothetical protein PsgB076_25244 [Pseudomonas savastanoi pv. glycinea str. B076]EGH06936.1 hypothetical protein Pgy4_03392 [Pseudomonas savastanoi pv. glycinea str. race 4]KEZ25284.1 hypothetical protein A3SK_0122070 [Pseudomonas amygdali pv. tabaci str. 6605]KEZ71018.1 hypothetical protein C1E_0201230 [Pseudomonas amygdali pv. tabaci str. ATCC 11528]KIY16228.1 hypothetical protein RD00_27060 [Pseudomonas amygdali pv. tabaci]KPW94498.1 hypothetical protein ALO50_103240 [Pseudomonas syring
MLLTDPEHARVAIGRSASTVELVVASMEDSAAALVAQVVKEPKNAPALALKPDQKLRLRPSGKRKNTRPTSQE